MPSASMSAMMTLVAPPATSAAAVACCSARLHQALVVQRSNRTGPERVDPPPAPQQAGLATRSRCVTSPPRPGASRLARHLRGLFRRSGSVRDQRRFTKSQFAHQQLSRAGMGGYVPQLLVRSLASSPGRPPIRCSTGSGTTCRSSSRFLACAIGLSRANVQSRREPHSDRTGWIETLPIGIASRACGRRSSRLGNRNERVSIELALRQIEQSYFRECAVERVRVESFVGYMVRCAACMPIQP